MGALIYPYVNSIHLGLEEHLGEYKLLPHKLGESGSLKTMLNNNNNNNINPTIVSCVCNSRSPTIRWDVSWKLASQPVCSMKLKG